MSNVSERIKNIFAGCLDLNGQQLKEEARIIDDLGADSLDIVDIIVSLEENFYVKITVEEAEDMLTVADVIKYMECRVPSSA